MSLFITEAVSIGLKEGIKLGLIWFVFSALLVSIDMRRLIRPFIAGLAVASLITLFSFFISLGLETREFISRLIGHVFFLFFVSSVVALYQSGGVNLLGPLTGILKRESVARPVVFISTVVYFAPDIIGSSSFIRELAEMKSSYAGVYASAGLSFIVSAIITAWLPLKVKGGAFRNYTARFFGVAQFLLFLSIMKLVLGGTRGFAELSLIPSVTRGTMKFVHDVVHQLFVFLMVPDHPILKVTVWNFIGILFGSNFALAVVLCLLLLPPVMFIYHSLWGPLPEASEAETGAERRIQKASVRAGRRKMAVPAIIFVLIISLSWYSSISEQSVRLYNPKPKPVVDDKGLVVLPLTDPTMDLMDGMIHKFSLTAGGENITLLVTKRPDGKLTVCLDACEICPPEGYGQVEGNVVCMYCRTPIPLDSLGEAGGCNPIPLQAEITGKDVRVSVSDILAKWEEVKSGKTKEAIR